MSPPKKKKTVVSSSSSSLSSNEVDRISELPESLIHQILSRLDTADVLRTSFLSTTFRSISKTTPTIRFDLEYWTSIVKKNWSNQFINLVENVVNSKRESSVLKFELSSKNNFFSYHLPHVSKWITKVLECGVQHLVLRFPLYSGNQTLVLPHHIFTSDVTVLEIWLLGDDPSISNVLLPNISVASKICDLRLCGVELPKGNGSGELVLDCGLLKDLVINNCDVQHLKVLKIATPLLEKMWIRLSTTKRDPRKLGVTICTPNLVSLALVAMQNRYHCEVTYSIEVDLLSLVDAEVFIITKERDFLEDWSMKILPRLYTAQKLKLTYSSEQALMELRELQKQIPYGFHNLRHIMLMDGTLAPRRRAIINFLESCPLLETIVWRKTSEILKSFACLNSARVQMGVSSSFLGDEAEDLMTNGENFLFLRTAEFKNIHGTDFEVECIASVLEKALHLRKVTIQYDSMLIYDSIKRRSWKKKILALPISSRDLTMNFLEPDSVVHPSKAHPLV